jgi:hypothetical protein
MNCKVDHTTTENTKQKIISPDKSLNGTQGVLMSQKVVKYKKSKLSEIRKKQFNSTGLRKKIVSEKMFLSKLAHTFAGLSKKTSLNKGSTWSKPSHTKTTSISKLL